MKNRTIIRARAKSAAAFYTTRLKLADVHVRDYVECLRRNLPTLSAYPWFVHIYVDGQPTVEETLGFNSESDAKCFASDLRKFCNLVEA